MSTPADLVQLALRLRSISRADGAIDAAQVRVIGLDEIRQAAGANWPRMRERVRSGSMEILTRHAAPEDVIVPAGDGFLVILAEGAPGNNQERCKRMREALLSFYLGEEALRDLRPEVTARTLSADGFADLMSSGVHAECSVVRPFPTPRETIVEARVFSVRDKKIAARWFSPMRRERGTRRLAYNGDYILDGHHHGKQFFDLDVALLEQVSLEFDEGAPSLPLGFTVHASTMQVRSQRNAYLALLAGAPAALRQRAIVTIGEIEKGAPLMSIAEWCCALRTLVGHVCLDFHYTDHALSSIGATGAWAAGFHLPIYSGAQSGPRATRTLEQIRFWSKTIRGQGMRLAVNGFQDPDFLDAAGAAGVDVATSDSLWPFKARGCEDSGATPLASMARNLATAV